MTPTVSVIIPFYNVELYLDECLRSVACQTLQEIEVILVDDGSTDDSVEIAKEFIANDARFRLIRQCNAGPGPARNAGIVRAHGEFVSFVDGDDVLVRNAYERLVDTLTVTGSDLACGGVLRFDGRGSWLSPLHDHIFSQPQQRTHIRQRPDLLADRTVWNKLYRASFWDRNRKTLEFPRSFFEDGIVAVRAHLAAEAVDLVPGPVYYWRRRDRGPASISQRTLSSPLLRDRVRQVGAICELLATVAPTLCREYRRMALGSDVRVLVAALPHLDRTDQQLVVDFARSFLGVVEPAALEELSHEDRVSYELLRGQDTAELLRSLSGRRWTDFL